MPIPRAPATKIVFNATGQQYRQTTSFIYLGGSVNEIPNLSDEIDRRIRAGWMGFKRYKRELYDRPKASLLPLKARMVRSEVVEALLYGCATWTPLKGHYGKFRTTHHRMLLRILEPGASRRTSASSRTKTPFSEPNARASKQPCARRGCCGRGLENAGKHGPGGKEKQWTDCVADDLRLFGITGDWSTVARLRPHNRVVNCPHDSSSSGCCLFRLPQWSF